MREARRKSSSNQIFTRSLEKFFRLRLSVSISKKGNISVSYRQRLLLGRLSNDPEPRILDHPGLQENSYKTQQIHRSMPCQSPRSAARSYRWPTRSSSQGGSYLLR